jgi:hypothetical protein
MRARVIQHSMVRRLVLPLIVGTLVIAGTALTVAAPAEAAAARTTVSPSSDGTGSAQTLAFRQTLPNGGSVTTVTIIVPTASITGVTLHAMSGTVTKSADLRFVVWRPTKPISMAKGARLTVVIGGFRLTAGRFTVTMRSWRGGTLLAVGSGSADIPAAAAACPASWPTVAQENAQPGDPGWTITTPSTAIGAYLSRTSAQCGDALSLYVNSTLDTMVRVKAYRMGYYGGAGARLVWQSSWYVIAWHQPAPLILSPVAATPDRMVTARNWGPTLGLTIDSRFAPGTYLFTVADRQGHTTYAPLTVRDETGTKHDLLLQNATSTWQAYNAYGGYGFYTKPSGAARVSFQRPYLANSGSGEYLKYEYGLVYWLERQGYDVTYWTDQDLDTRGASLPSRTRSLVMGGHDEYFSAAMRNAVLAGLSTGVNLVSLGANAAFRVIDPSPDGREFFIDTPWVNSQSTWWRSRGTPFHEQAWLGAEYGCQGNGTPVADAAWLWTGVPAGTALTGLSNGEIDTVYPGAPSPAGVKVLADVPLLACTEGLGMHAMITAYTAPSGARVFDGSSLAWSCYLIAYCPWYKTGTATLSIAPELANAEGQVVTNIVAWAATGVEPGTAAAARSVSPLRTGSTNGSGRLPSVTLPPLSPDPPE